MHKTRKHRKSRSRTRSRSRSQRGGDLNGNPPSAWGWGLGTLGNGWTQFMNTLTLQPGQNLGSAQSNAIVPVGNVNAQNTRQAVGPDLKGGRRRGYKKRGGNLAAIASQAAVPLILLGAQQTYKKRSRKH